MHACLHCNIYVNAVTQCDIGHVTLTYCWPLFSLYWYTILLLTEPWINMTFVFTIMYEPSQYALWRWYNWLISTVHMTVNWLLMRTQIKPPYVKYGYIHEYCSIIFVQNVCHTAEVSAKHEMFLSTYRVLVTSYCDIKLGPHWFGWWLDACQHHCWHIVSKVMWH